MDWGTVWLVVLGVTLVVFVPLSVVVAIWGGFDIVHLVRALGRDGRDEKD